MASEARKRLGVWCTLVTAVLISLLLSGCATGLGDARKLERQGDISGAIALYRESLRQDPHDLRAMNALAIDLLLLGDYDAALEVQENIVRLDPKDSLTRVELAFNYLNHQDRPADAVTYLKQAAELDPIAKNWAFLAQAQIESGDEAGAEESLGRSLEADSTYPHAYSLLLALLEGQGRTDEALALRQMAAENGVTLRN